WCPTRPCLSVHPKPRHARPRLSARPCRRTARSCLAPDRTGRCDTRLRFSEARADTPKQIASAAVQRLNHVLWISKKNDTVMHQRRLFLISPPPAAGPKRGGGPRLSRVGFGAGGVTPRAGYPPRRISQSPGSGLWSISSVTGLSFVRTLPSAIATEHSASIADTP